jgi:hypothetical protein
MTMSEPRPLRVPKKTLEVELALTGETPRRVELFLAEHGSHDFNRQSVLELLDQGRSFLPVRDLETGVWEAFNSRAVVWIGMSRVAADAEDSGDELYDHQNLVRVALLGGGALEGEILYSAPEGAARVVDVLNRRERFFRLWSGDRVFLVNKDFVLRLVEATISGEQASCR